MKKLLLTALCLMGFSVQSQAVELFELSEQCENINMGMIRCTIDEEVSFDEAIQSMKLRANGLNFKMVGHLPLSEQIKANGGKSERMEIFQFCDAKIAKQMVEHDMDFGAYLPCRITLVEDENGKFWLVMMKLEMFIAMANLPEDILALANHVKDTLNEIIQAGAAGEL